MSRIYNCSYKALSFLNATRTAIKYQLLTGNKNTVMTQRPFRAKVDLVMDSPVGGAWHSIPGYEGYYEVWISEDQSSGTVRSLERRIRKGAGFTTLQASVLKPSRAGR